MGRTGEAIATLKAAVTHTPASAIAHARLGLALWPADRAASAPCFLQAAKLDSTITIAFVYLGHYYTDGGQAERGTRCYQKAMSLDPMCAEAGERLHALFVAAGNNDAAMAMLDAACRAAGPGRAAWAWIRMGAAHICDANFSEAVVCLQNALKSNSTVSQLNFRVTHLIDSIISISVFWFAYSGHRCCSSRKSSEANHNHV
jgi:tetratricopeptide (TPR) repeat protein